MTIEQTLLERSNSACELCASDRALSVYHLPPVSDVRAENSILICDTCNEQINAPEKIMPDHWRCLNNSMWSQEPAVQVMVWRLLSCLSTESWAQDLLDMLYLNDNLQSLAESEPLLDNNDTHSDHHVDSNGTALNVGDSVTLIKDLEVKGANFTAKRGTMVKSISLTDNSKQIEGRVNGIRIVLLTQFLKKVS